MFTEFLLADEINRTPPKTQAALLRGDAGADVTIDGTSHPLSAGFMVVATQNPIEQEGTYPLPEAQLDRFLFKVLIGYPGRDEELTMVQDPRPPDGDAATSTGWGSTPLCDLRFITWVRQVVSGIRLADETVAYVVDLIRATRNHPALQYGASPRAANMLAAASRAAAVLEGRDFVIPDDVKGLFKPLLRHRVVLSPSAEVDGLGADPVLDQILDAGGGAAIASMRPTRRAILLAALGLPVALLPVAVHPAVAVLAGLPGTDGAGHGRRRAAGRRAARRSPARSRCRARSTSASEEEAVLTVPGAVRPADAGGGGGRPLGPAGAAAAAARPDRRRERRAALPARPPAARADRRRARLGRARRGRSA